MYINGDTLTTFGLLYQCFQESESSANTTKLYLPTVRQIAIPNYIAAIRPHQQRSFNYIPTLLIDYQNKRELRESGFSALSLGYLAERVASGGKEIPPIRMAKQVSNSVNSYEVQDPEPDEAGGHGKYRALASALIPIPKDSAGLAPYPNGKQVLARYPETTTFYKAEVIGTKVGNTLYGMRIVFICHFLDPNC